MPKQQPDSHAAQVCWVSEHPSPSESTGSCGFLSPPDVLSEACYLGGVDVVLSSGFLAFARHLGALEAMVERRIKISAIVGTSSGALVGALVQSGMPLVDIARLLSAKPPLWSLRLNSKPWQGLFSARQMVRVLQRHLPQTFAELAGPLALGVCDESGRHRLLCAGDLMTALLASTAIPHVFPPVARDGHRYVDGGIVDRTGVTAWRQWRPQHQAIVHVVARSRGRDVAFDQSNTIVINTPRAKARFWSLGDFERQQREARELARMRLDSCTQPEKLGSLAADGLC